MAHDRPPRVAKRKDSQTIEEQNYLIWSDLNALRDIWRKPGTAHYLATAMPSVKHGSLWQSAIDWRPVQSAPCSRIASSPKHDLNLDERKRMDRCMCFSSLKNRWQSLLENMDQCLLWTLLFLWRKQIYQIQNVSFFRKICKFYYYFNAFSEAWHWIVLWGCLFHQKLGD